MSKRSVSEELANQIEHESEERDLWMQEPVQIESRPSRTSVLSLRLPAAEFRALLHAAARVNESVSEYVRKAISLRQKFEQSSATINITYTETTTTQNTQNRIEIPQMPTWSTWTAGGVGVNSPSLP